MDSTVFLIIIVAILYFLPAVVAAGRERNGGVLVLNIFLGWTLIGWVVALAWAASLPHKAKPTATGTAAADIDAGQVLAKDSDGNLIPATDAPAVAVACPFCAEDIKPEAIVCKHCGRDLPTKESA